MPNFGQGRNGGGPPPWWPDGATWPPPEGTRPRVRRRFLFLILIPIVLLVLLFFAVIVTAFFAVGGPSNHGDGGGGWKGPPIAGIVFAVIAIIAIVRFLRRTAEPIGEIMEAAERVADGDYTTRVQVRGPRDVRRLAAVFNQMVERIEDSDGQRRRLLSDVTHELRTPLAIIQGNAEGLLDGVYPRDDAHLIPLIEETKQMARLLDDLHTLATAESGALKLHRESTDIDTLISDVVAAFSQQASGRGVSIGFQPESRSDVDIDPVRIRQVIENVIANALRYTPAGGAVTIEVIQSSQELAISIGDTGPGVSVDDLPHLFDRFVKSADSGGSGLGLNIAKSLVEAHGGSISARNREPGGLEVSISIPLSL